MSTTARTRRCSLQRKQTNKCKHDTNKKTPISRDEVWLANGCATAAMSFQPGLRAGVTQAHLSV